MSESQAPASTGHRLRHQLPLLVWLVLVWNLLWGTGSWANLLGGIVVPVADLPTPIRDFAGVLPSTVLAEAIGLGLGTAGVGSAIVPLAAWAVAAIAAATLTFRAE